MALIEPTGQSPPRDLYDEDHCLLALRADRYTRGQAQAAFATEAGVGFTEMRTRRAVYRYPVEYVEEMKEDGIAEPYDGWPWQECGPGEDGTAYWQRVDDNSAR
jgi:hypothetical protein